MEELKALIQDFSSVVRTRLDDHDILIELRTTQQHTFQQVNTLVGQLAKTVDDHEARIRRMERVIFYGLGAVGLATTMYKLLSGKLL